MNHEGLTPKVSWVAFYAIVCGPVECYPMSQHTLQWSAHYRHTLADRWISLTCPGGPANHSTKWVWSITSMLINMAFRCPFSCMLSSLASECAHPFECNQEFSWCNSTRALCTLVTSVLLAAMLKGCLYHHWLSEGDLLGIFSKLLLYEVYWEGQCQKVVRVASSPH